MKQLIRDALITLATLVAVFVLVLVLQRFFAVARLIPMLFVLGVFIVALNTKGYFWGVAASLLGVLAVNYAFMFPYYAIDLITPVNMATAVVMLIVSVMTSTLTTQLSIHQQEKAAAERERMRANLLRAISHDLRTPLTSISGACSVMLDNRDTLSEEKQLTLLSDMRRDAELLARVRAALRCSRPTAQSQLPESRFRLYDLTIEYESRTVTVDSQPIHLTQTEYNILALLAQHAGKLLTYAAMNETIWGASDPGGNKKLQVNMANLRRKLGIRPGDNRYIVNELGVGYRMQQNEADAEKQ